MKKPKGKFDKIKDKKLRYDISALKFKFSIHPNISNHLINNQNYRENEQEKSSHVWICTSTHAISKVTVIDANSPADVLETFQVCSSHLLCIASVPGAKESDYR